MNTNAKSYTAGQAANAVGIAYHQLNHWATTGIVVPSINEGEGHGGVREYSLADIVALKVAADLKEKGFALSRFRGLLTRIQAWTDGSKNTFFVGTDNGSVEGLCELDALATLRSMERKGLTWCVSIAEIVEDMKTRLNSLSRPLRGKKLKVS